MQLKASMEQINSQLSVELLHAKHVGSFGYRHDHDCAVPNVRKNVAELSQVAGAQGLQRYQGLRWGSRETTGRPMGLSWTEIDPCLGRKTPRGGITQGPNQGSYVGLRTSDWIPMRVLDSGRRILHSEAFALKTELDNIFVTIQLAGLTVGEILPEDAAQDRYDATQKPVNCRAIFDFKYLGGSLAQLKCRIVVNGRELSMLLRNVANATLSCKGTGIPRPVPLPV